LNAQHDADFYVSQQSFDSQIEEFKITINQEKAEKKKSTKEKKKELTWCHFNFLVKIGN